MFNVPEEEVTKVQRSRTKFVNFGFMYGRGLRSVAEEHGLTLDEAQEIRNYLFGRYPKAQQWLDDIVQEAYANKQVSNLYGRIRHLRGFIDSDLEGVRAQAERQAQNSPIQGGASDTNNLAAFLCQRAIDNMIAEQHIDAHVVLLIHDQIIYRVRTDQLERLDTVTADIMKHPSNRINVVLDTDSEAGFKIGSMKPTHEFLQELYNVESAG